MENAIAVIGIDCKFPGAKNKNEYWELLKNGVEAVKNIVKESSEENSKNSNHIKMGARVDDIDKFDAEFFNINPIEAKFMDPQHRLFLQSAWNAIEDAGYNVEKINCSVGVFAGVGISTYLIYNVLPMAIQKNNLEKYKVAILHGNSSDYLATRVSYKLNFKGPSMVVQTACSSSLTAISLACRSLLTYECDMALSGGVSINVLQDEGYLYNPGEILSSSGHCRPFDEGADGTVFGGGVGTVTLKRYEDAIEDGDYIYAIIRGTAINNDGNDKVSYMAPSVNGQANVIKDAIDFANISPKTISYIEAHGTGTKIGDPIEVNALKEIMPYEGKKYCSIGSVKGNIGHSIAASGIAGLIKVILSLEKGYLCPSINCENVNKELGLENSVFEINREFKKWEKIYGVRRAGVSSFGMGGSNVHMILEGYDFETPKRKNSNQLKALKLSAKTYDSLLSIKKNLGIYLTNNNVNDDDLLFTYNLNRKDFKCRESFIYRSQSELIEKLNASELNQSLYEKKDLVMSFENFDLSKMDLFKDMYENIEIFKNTINTCAEVLNHKGINLIHILSNESANGINDTDKLPIRIALGFCFAKTMKELGSEFKLEVANKLYTDLEKAINNDDISFDDLLMMHTDEQQEESLEYEVSKREETGYINVNSEKNQFIINSYSSFLNLISNLWMSGYDIRFEELYDYKNAVKKPFPSYEFDRKSYWIDSKYDNYGESVKEIEINEDDIKNRDISKIVKQYWSKFLGIKEIEEDENFFELGGHSLLAIQIITEIEELFKISIPLEDVLIEPTIGNMSNIIRKIKN